MAIITVNVAVNLYEVSTTDLVDELSSRGCTVFDKSNKCVSDLKKVSLEKQLPEDYVLCRDFDRHKLRDHLLNLTGQGSYVSDDELLEQLKYLLANG